MVMGLRKSPEVQKELVAESSSFVQIGRTKFPRSASPQGPNLDPTPFGFLLLQQ
ncbi:hypothetical protein FRC19_004379 [Serendipita sp. 401]|nr:hypothetical protein FRC19_004379 [Serendipita sp. 401]